MACLGVAPQVEGQGIAVHLRHHDICDHQSRRLVWNDFKGLFAIAGGDHRVALEAQCHIEQIENVGNVFYDEDGVAHGDNSSRILH